MLCLPFLLQADPEVSNLPPPADLKAAPDFFIRVEDTGCRILIADVHLKIGDLFFERGETPSLTGTYDIRVPLRSSKNETGGLILPLEEPLAVYFRDGGTITGRGKSFQRPDAKRVITCHVKPDEAEPRNGRLRLEIDTGKRVMEFETTYTVMGKLPTELILNQAETAAGRLMESPRSGDES